MDANQSAPLPQVNQTSPQNPVVTTNSPQINNITKPERSLRWFLIIFGILEIPFPIIALNTGIQLLQLQNSLNINSIAPFLGFGFFSIALLLALAQLIIGVLSLESKLGKKKTKWLFIVGLVLAILTIPAIILFFITPIYNLTAGF